MNKICLITHGADADGAFPIILAKLVFSDLDIFSCEVGEVDLILKEAIKNQEKYSFIYVVDLAMSKALADEIESNQILLEKIKVFDHHQSQLFLNDYPFVEVIVEQQDGKKECGTTLFYNFLKEVSKKDILVKPCVREMVELVREMDTYDFIEDKKEKSFRFGNLYSIYGRERYIEHFYSYILENENFDFSDIEKLLIELHEEKVKNYIEEKMKHILFAKIMGVSVGIVFTEQNRSYLGHAMVEKLDIEIAVVINVDRSVSYRAYKEEVDVSVLTIPNGGGGHKHAGGSPLPDNLQEKICEIIFKEIEWKK